jgi:aspartate aminotransferase-like enzyme
LAYTTGANLAGFQGVGVMMQKCLPPQQLLLEPGPSLVHARALQAMAALLVGHLDPAGFQQRTQPCSQQPASIAHNGKS